MKNICMKTKSALVWIYTHELMYRNYRSYNWIVPRRAGTRSRV